MTIREIRNELEKIYKERRSWDGAKGPFTKSAIRRKELILIKQQLLYQIENAKRAQDKRQEFFYAELYKVVNNHLEC